MLEYELMFSFSGRSEYSDPKFWLTQAHTSCLIHFCRDQNIYLIWLWENMTKFWYNNSHWIVEMLYNVKYLYTYPTNLWKINNKKTIQSTVLSLLCISIQIALIYKLKQICYSECQMVDSDCHCISDVFTIHTTGDVIILCTFKTKS